jgi:hypothetical protein
MIRDFNYHKYPAYFNIHINAGEYAWKPVIIEEVMNELGEEYKGELLWCDAGNKVNGSLSFLIDIIKKNAIYSPISDGSISKWTHPKTLQSLQIHQRNPILRMRMRAGGFCGFDLSQSEVRNFIQLLSKFAQTKSVIAPEGSSRKNHRQDQSILSILYYMFMKSFPFRDVPYYVSMLIWQDEYAPVLF